MKKGKLLLLVLLVLVLLPSLAGAQSRWDHSKRYRFYGIADFSYRNYSGEVNGAKEEQKTFGMQYSLGLSGYIWRPRLALFRSEIYFSFYKQTPKSDSRGIGFNFESLIFPMTRFPLSLNASRSTSTLDGFLGLNNTTTITQFSSRWSYSSRTNKMFSIAHSHSIYERDNQNTGKTESTFDYFTISLRGSPYFDRGSFLNNFRNNNRNNFRNNNRNNNSNNDNTEDNSEDGGNNGGNNNSNLNNNNNNTNLSHRSSSDFGLGITWGVQYELQKYKTDSGSSSDTGKSQRLSLFAQRDLFNFFSAYADLVFYKSDTNKDTHFSFSLQRRTEKFYSYNSYAFSMLDDHNVKSTSHDIRTSNIYNYSKNLTFNGNLSYNRYTRENEDTQNKYEANLGANYNYHYSKRFDSSILTAYAGTGLSSSMNSATGSSSHSYALYLSYGSRYETYQRTNGLFLYSYYGELIGTADTEGSINDSISLGISASRSFRKFTLTSSASLGYSINMPSEGASSNGLSFVLNAGLYARPTRYSTFSATAQYSAYRSGSSSSNSLILNENLKIDLYRNFYLTVAATQTMTSSDGNTSKSNEILTSLNYRIRKLYLHGEYNISSRDDNGNIINKRVIFLRATRPF
ncbi:MAG: hypothetical protein A2X59_00430 [Nitrospirae bacterium GWC2_42_7]|nr:MAG: hypothetical protein A2X59_00430 [Nitrospirae bacterium GWC2_42_7]